MEERVIHSIADLGWEGEEGRSSGIARERVALSDRFRVLCVEALESYGHLRVGRL